jgi:hypothetical protein
MYDSYIKKKNYYFEVEEADTDLYWWVIRIDGERHCKMLVTELEVIEACGLVKETLGKGFVVEYEKII